jgi:hypothetical protein
LPRRAKRAHGDEIDLSSLIKPMFTPDSEGRMLAGHLALIAAALFAGGGLHITLAEQPARLRLDDQAMLAEWKPSFTFAQRIAAPLAILGSGLGLIAWWMTGRAHWSAGAFLLGAVVPYTLIRIKPINDQLLAIATPEAGPTSRALIVRWGQLHNVRVVVALVAIACFVWASLT